MEALKSDKNPLTDEELCSLAASGDRVAEELLVIRHSRLVRICARPFYLAGGDREDLFQEGMMGLIAAIRRFDPEKQALFFTFAATCIRNRIVSAIKAASRNKHAPLNTYISLETPLFDGKADLHDWEAVGRSPRNPEEIVLDKEALCERLENLKGQLSGFEAQILALYLDGLSYLEIACEVNRPQKSVDNAVQRIQRKLRGSLNLANSAMAERNIMKVPNRS